MPGFVIENAVHEEVLRLGKREGNEADLPVVTAFHHETAKIID
jgi:hypothetical protein